MSYITKYMYICYNTVIAFANTHYCFRYSGAALTSLNLASNELKAEGAKHVAEAIKGHVSALRFY